MSVLSRLGVYGLVLVAVFAAAYGLGALVGPLNSEAATVPATTQEYR